MCGIVGLYAKRPELSAELGHHVARMLAQMADRGPDSAGVAVYRDPVDAGASKVTVSSRTGTAEWDAVARRLREAGPLLGLAEVGPRHAIARLAMPAAEARLLVRTTLPDVIVNSAGSDIEIYKDATSPARFAESIGLEDMAGTHAIGHTRMATESRVTPAGSHPFSTGSDLCLVHNGSLSNHNRLREGLRARGVVFETENDSEVAAAYLGQRLADGDDLQEALTACLEDLDGFYTFAVGTRTGFAVLRDPIACKPAVLAETDQWVAMASEFRAIDVLPGSSDAEVWEPEPATVYAWDAAKVPA